MSFTCKEPKLRFPEFCGEWAEKNFGDIYTFFNTNSFSRASLNYDCGEVKNIHYGDIHTKFQSNFYIHNENVPFINETEDLSKISEEAYCKEKDLVIADASEDYKDIGKAIELISLNNEKLLAGLHTYIARDTNDEMALGFSGYLMQTFKIRLQMMKFAVGISVLGISKGNLSKMKITIPAKPEQEKIASFLTAVDAKIEQLTCKEKLLEKYKKSVMQKLFSQELCFTCNDGSEYPEWEEKKLGKLCKIRTGKLDANAMNKNGKYRFYTCAKEYYQIDNYAFDTDALIISGNGANVGYIHHYNGKFNAYQRTYVLDEFKDEIIFIKYFLDQNLYQRIFIEKKEGNTPYIVLGTLSEMDILLPSLPEQTKIANFLSAIDEKLLHVKAQIEQTKQFKKALLQQMFV